MFWKPGAIRLSEHFTKHHPFNYHRRIHPVYLHCQDNKNNASARVFNYSQNTSLKERTKQDSNKETQFEKMKNGKTQTDILT